MVKAAEDQWPTLDKDFGRLLDDWRQLGLIGKAISKAPRRGGEGLWHPNQLVIWMNPIAFRFDQGLRVPTLPNWPVGLWRLGTDGIELEQVQRAFELWVGYLTGRPDSDVKTRGSRRPRGDGRSWSKNRPTGERSLRRKAIEARVEHLSAPGAAAAQKRSLRTLLEIINDGVDVSPDTYVARLLPVLAPEGEPTEKQRQLAENQYRVIRVQKLAVAYLDQLCTPVAFPLWQWIERHDQVHVPRYLSGNS